MRPVKQRDDDISWMDDAACKGRTHLFYPVGNDGRSNETRAASESARLICAGCPVRDECLTYAVRWREKYGIWGGQSTRERFGTPRRPSMKEKLERGRV